MRPSRKFESIMAERRERIEQDNEETAHRLSRLKSRKQALNESRENA
jgi:hypothetical protein